MADGFGGTLANQSGNFRELKKFNQWKNTYKLMDFLEYILKFISPSFLNSFSE